MNYVRNNPCTREPQLCKSSEQVVHRQIPFHDKAKLFLLLRTPVMRTCSMYSGTQSRKSQRRSVGSQLDSRSPQDVKPLEEQR